MFNRIWRPPGLPRRFFAAFAPPGNLCKTWLSLWASFANGYLQHIGLTILLPQLSTMGRSAFGISIMMDIILLGLGRYLAQSSASISTIMCWVGFSCKQSIVALTAMGWGFGRYKGRNLARGNKIGNWLLVASQLPALPLIIVLPILATPERAASHWFLLYIVRWHSGFLMVHANLVVALYPPGDFGMWNFRLGGYTGPSRFYVSEDRKPRLQSTGQRRT